MWIYVSNIKTKVATGEGIIELSKHFSPWCLSTFQMSFMALKKTKTKLHENIVQTLINNLFIRQCVFIKIWSMQEVWVHKRCTRVAWGTADIWTDCFITFSTRWKIFFLRDLLADVMSMHNRNMKHAYTIEFDWTNLLAML